MHTVQPAHHETAGNDNHRSESLSRMLHANKMVTAQLDVMGPWDLCSWCHLSLELCQFCGAEKEIPLLNGALLLSFLPNFLLWLVKTQTFVIAQWGAIEEFRCGKYRDQIPFLGWKRQKAAGD
jgi:hypothetical protein